MTRRLPPAAMNGMKLAAIPVAAIVIGILVALASSPSSLGRGHALGTPVPATPSPVSATPVQSVTDPGILGKGPQLVAAGMQSLAGMSANRAAGSADGGKTWTTLVPPAGASGVAIDPANPQHGIAGGGAIKVTADGGATWKAAQTSPPPGAPYVPLQVSPFDGNIWFFVHGGKLLRTRDSSATWRDIAGLPALNAPVLVAGQTFGQFYLASGGTIFSLVDNGQQVLTLAPLPGGESVTALASVGGGDATLFARGSNGGLFLLKGDKWSAVSGAPAGPITAGANGILIVGNGGAKLGSPGIVTYSTDSGATWRQATGLPYDQSVEAVAGQPTGVTFVAYGYGGDIYGSPNGGRDWVLLSRALRSRAG
ncbi:MAG TPA: hypothetical protein VFH00_08925 [Candidatus Nitrosotalea sp.]|nr:hypothetical protein [Candidatus Nitrosotalea sp.]